ncbi:GtrA family protein [Palleronia rufa]|uniref:GtrA family protein n=1 Tax=Palleronia rufa TaxID=1530186 RepID=UPI0005694EDC|nr:GtrA family protein [Palleronia rufa]
MTVVRLLMDARFARFLGTGVVNTGFGYGVFLLGLTLGLAPGLALALQFALGIPFNYMLHGRYVFGTRGVGRLPSYALAYLVLYGVNLLFLWALSEVMPAAIAQGLMLLPMAALSFLVLSRLMRRREG